VKNLRLDNKIPVFAEGRQRSWLTLAEAASELHVGAGVIRTMVKYRILEARQVAKGAPWIIQRADLERAEVRDYAKEARSGKHAPRQEDSQTLMPYLTARNAAEQRRAICSLV
jgi:hypothetical protein